MTATLRKGWCPGALRPMAARDGLIVRLRITGGILPPATAQALAGLAERFGNGLLDLSARGNLQLRGVHDATLDALRDGLRALGLLDANAAAESVRNVIASPLAGLHDGLDIRQLTAALERRLIDDLSLHRLPGKFGFLIDDGSQPLLAGVGADIRFDWTAEANAFSIGLGGDAAGAHRIGLCGAGALVERAGAVATAFLSTRDQAPEARRMRELLDIVGSDGAARVFGGSDPSDFRGRAPTTARDLVGRQIVAGIGSTLGLAAPFGRLTADMLRGAAALGEIRLTPWRVMLVPHATDGSPRPGFIIDPEDPRLAVAACVGAPGCARGSTDAQADAAHLAAVLPVHARDIAVHVSGCAKGCAKPSATAVTLVGREGRYDLVRNGRTCDPPERAGLDLAAAMAALHAAPEPA